MNHPFEPLSDIPLDVLTFKTAFLLAITSAKRVGELQAFSMDPRYMHITPAGIRLRLNPAFIPKVDVDKNREQELFFAPYPPPDLLPSSENLQALCVRRVVSKYVEVTQPFRSSDQLLVCFGGSKKGGPAAKATISRWVRDCIKLAYSSQNLTLDGGVRAHDTRSVSATWAQFNNASLKDICDTASWSNSSTFATHYQLNIAGSEPSARFAEAVLQTALESP
jgi:hypothetical protein